MNVAEYSHSKRFIFPECDTVSMSSPLAWKLYWIELKQRVLPSLMKYQATLLFMHFFKGFLSTLISKENLLRLNQHPPRRAVAIAERESDRLLVGVEVFVATLWANTLFFAANYTVQQIGALFNFYTRCRLANSRGSQFCDREDTAHLANTSWGLLASNARRYVYSALGAGLGSIVWPGWGTLLGIGMGDEWAKKQPESELPQQVITIIGGGFNNFFSAFGRIRIFDWWSRRGGRSGDDDFEKPHSVHDDLICGCCQTTPFSSNPNSRDRTPISSRACSHTICKACVQQCHLAFMERTNNYAEWIKCPLCNTEQAFSSQNHIVNRTLCAAIAAIELSHERSTKTV